MRLALLAASERNRHSEVFRMMGEQIEDVQTAVAESSELDIDQ